jgi:hypothetical protein
MYERQCWRIPSFETFQGYVIAMPYHVTRSVPKIIAPSREFWQVLDKLAVSISGNLANVWFTAETSANLHATNAVRLDT